MHPPVCSSLSVVRSWLSTAYATRHTTSIRSTASPRSIRAAAEEVARARGFEPDWLNDRVAGFAPVGLDEDECEVFYEHPRLRVLGPPPDYVFLMKLYAARGGPDHDDMVALWPRCSFTSAEDAASRFAAVYPHVRRDTASRCVHHHDRKRSRSFRLSAATYDSRGLLAACCGPGDGLFPWSERARHSVRRIGRLATTKPVTRGKSKSRTVNVAH